MRAGVGTSVVIAQPTDCCCCQVSHTTDMSYTQLNIKPRDQLNLGLIIPWRGTHIKSTHGSWHKRITADATDVTAVTNLTVSFDQLTPPDPTKRD